ncbi:MAG TPA: protein kinase [Candidatus Baltobacteraceae bacterium]|jgi:serine/threonine protein kinase
MTERIGSIIAQRYKVDKLIGRGGMADVYHGTDSVLQREIAVKILTDRSEIVRKRFLREAQSMAHLNHRNIVGVYDAGEDQDQLYIIMELIRGRTLKQASAEGISYDASIKIFIELLQALDYAHKQSVIHRDIKPANIMILDNGEVKVMDFGLSRRVSDASSVTQAGEIVGTIAYLSPERFLGKVTDHRSDLYSVGCVMYEIFTGDVPFKSPSDDLVSVIFAHVNDTPASVRDKNPNLSPALERIIMKLLAKDPTDRYADASDVITDLESLSRMPSMTSAGAPAPPPPAPATPGSPPTPPPRDLKAVLGTAIEAHRSGNPEAVKQMLTHAFRPAEMLRDAQRHVLTAMLAARKHDYVEGTKAYTAALDGFKAVNNELEFGRTAVRYAAMVVEQCTREEKVDDDKVDSAIKALSDALPVLRGKRLFSELEQGERTLYALRRIRVGTGR